MEQQLTRLKKDSAVILIFKKNVVFSLIFLLISSLYIGKVTGQNDPFVFTTCGEVGRFGPTQSDCDSEYLGTNLDGDVTVDGDGIQTWKVPDDDDYLIEVFGGGYDEYASQKGAIMRGTFELNEGQELKILAGQLGTNQWCGAGGTFVTDINDNPLIIAGGSGGATSDDAIIMGTTDGDGQGPGGGTGGNGGNAEGACFGQAGAGLLGDGDGCDDEQASAFINGGFGALGSGEEGGFGGGGTGRHDGRMGGGGGYSGGQGQSAPPPPGGGGGSYNDGFDQNNESGAHAGPGMVKITPLTPPGPPTADFHVQDTIWTGASRNIQNTSLRASENNWYIDGVHYSNEENLTFPDTIPGQYTISLAVSNEEGSDSIAKNAIVADPTQLPTVNFFSSQNVFTPNETIRLTDLSSHGPFDWIWTVTPEEYDDPVSPGTLPRYDPSSIPNEPQTDITFYNWTPGLYDVSLEVENLLGSADLTKEDYLTVAYYINPVETEIGSDGADELKTTTDPNGYLVDHEGGVSTTGWDAPYGEEEGHFNINGECGELYIVVDNLELECGVDFLRIYDGEDSDGEPLFDHCSGNGFTGGGDQDCDSEDVCLPPDTLYSKTSSFYIEFEGGDNEDNLRGFRLHWGSEEQQAPEVYFEVPDTVCVGSIIEFDNQTTGSNIEGYAWDYQAPSGFLDSTKDGSFQYGVAGNYTPRLYVRDCAGNEESYERNITAISPEQPSGEIAISESQPFEGDTVQLDATIYGCIDNLEWSISPGGFEFVEGYNEHSRSPQVVFSGPGCYDVKVNVENDAGSATLGSNCNVEVRGYCTPTAGQAIGDIGVSSMSLSNLSFSKSEMGGSVYYDYSDEPEYQINLEAGQTYHVELKRQTSSNPMDVAIWIDYAGLGITDSISLVSFGSNISGKSYSDSITIPMEASGQDTRLRVGTGLGGHGIEFCGGQIVGEFLDFTVSIEASTQPPELTLLGDDPQHVEVFDSYVELGAEATDAAGNDITSAIEIDNSEVDTSTVGEYSVHYEVTDLGGNMASATRRVIVEDTEAPEIELLGADTILHGVNEEFEDPGVEITDNYWEDIEPAISSELDESELGIYAHEYCATDGSGNGPVCVTRYIEVIDTIAPEVHFAAGDTDVVEAGSEYVGPDYEVTDNYWSAAEIDVEIGGTFSGTDTLGVFTYEVTVTDQSGNAATETLIIRIEDTTPPEITLNGDRDVRLLQYEDWDDPMVTVTDNFDPSPEIIVQGNFEGTDRWGTFIRVYYAVDASGNESEEVKRTIFVQDASNIDGELESGSVSMYPNPVTDHLTIASTLESDYEYEVRDVSGRLLLEGSVEENTGEYELDMSNLASGSYLVRINAGGESVIKEIIQVQ